MSVRLGARYIRPAWLPLTGQHCGRVKAKKEALREDAGIAGPRIKAARHFHSAVYAERHRPSSPPVTARDTTLAGSQAPQPALSSEKPEEQDRKRDFRLQRQSRGRPAPAASPARRERSRPEPLRPPQGRSQGYCRPPAGPDAGADSRAPRTSHRTARPGPPSRRGRCHGFDRDPAPPGPTKELFSSLCPSLGCQPAKGAPRLAPALTGQAAPRAAPCRLNVPGPPKATSGSEAAYGPRHGPEGLAREALSPHSTLAGRPLCWGRSPGRPLMTWGGPTAWGCRACSAWRSRGLETHIGKGLVRVARC